MMNEDNILSMYLDEINRIPLLTRQEEIDLATLAQNGDKAAKDKIVKANLRFVVNVAKKYQNQGLELSDLISEGNIGLITAIEHFDVSKGYHFISYAVWWIRQVILKAVSEKSRAIRLPLNRVNQLVQIERTKKAIRGNKTDEQEFAEIAEILDMDANLVRDLSNISREMLSLDAPFFGKDDTGVSIGEFIADTTHDTPEEAAISSMLKDDIDNVLSTLRPNEQKVIRMRYGLNGRKPMSLKEVGDEFHVTKERIRQIEKRAISRMQHPRRVRYLESYVAA